MTGRAALEPAGGPLARRLLAAYFDELHQLLGLDGVAPPASADELSPPGGGFVVLRDEAEEAVACGGFRRLGPDVCEIKHMFVLPAARGRGLGRLLLAETERAARAAGYAEARLDTAAPLTAALALYRSCGYEAIASYNDNPHASHWLEKRLEA